MYLMKTPEGQQAFKERHADLSQRLRSAFLLFDGARSLDQVLAATSGMGVQKDDLLTLVTRGWLVARADSPPVAEAAATVAPAASETAAATPIDPASMSWRYQQAYPLAVSITGGLGLKGFRLNLAVEAAMGYVQLVALAPRIRDAAGDKAYARLHSALFEPLAA